MVFPARQMIFDVIGDLLADLIEPLPDSDRSAARVRRSPCAFLKNYRQFARKPTKLSLIRGR
jgi:hypothetical protein